MPGEWRHGWEKESKVKGVERGLKRELQTKIECAQKVQKTLFRRIISVE